MYQYKSGAYEQIKMEMSLKVGLDSNNRWIQLAKIVPWDKIEDLYSQKFLNWKEGRPAKPSRMAVGALIIRAKLGLTDEETVQAIIENPYLQAFIGLTEFTTEQPFSPKSMTYFRKRIKLYELRKINQLIANKAKKQKEDKNNKDNTEDGNSSNIPPNDKGKDENPTHKGKLLLDATCVPADIAYPTDISLLNQARKLTERFIDTLHVPLMGSVRKPRTDRNLAQKAYLSTAKQRKPRRAVIRKQIRKQLGYLRRNLISINRQIVQLSALNIAAPLSGIQQEKLEMIRILYRQQNTMYQTNTHSISDRIVSLAQPHVRPIKRGKAGASTEFGAKVAVSVVDGFCFIDRLSWDNFNESSQLIGAVEQYKQTYGYYPEAVLADQLYRNNENRKFCKDYGIRLSGPKLGRPKKTPDLKEKETAYQDNVQRNEIESKFGIGKRKYSLDRILTKLKETSETEIAMIFLVMNLEHRLRLSFFQKLFVSKVLLQRYMAFVERTGRKKLKVTQICGYRLAYM